MSSEIIIRVTCDAPSCKRYVEVKRQNEDFGRSLRDLIDLTGWTGTLRTSGGKIEPRFALCPTHSRIAGFTT